MNSFIPTKSSLHLPRASMKGKLTINTDVDNIQICAMDYQIILYLTINMSITSHNRMKSVLHRETTAR